MTKTSISRSKKSASSPKKKAVSPSDKESKPKKVLSPHEDELELLLKLFGFPKFQKQYKPSSVRNFSIDFAWPEHRVAIEVHGGYRGSVYKEVVRNYEKANWMTVNRWKVIHATPSMITQCSALVGAFKLLDDAGAILWTDGKLKLFNGEIVSDLVPRNRHLRSFYIDWMLAEKDVHYN